jgi:glyoxylase-like metal-dependent hydrolase (beta-lactamase superfamily II)
MKTGRRAFLSSAAAGSTAALFAPRRSLAAAPFAAAQAPGYYRFQLGDAQVTVLHDGERSFPMPAQFVTNVPHDQALLAASAAYMPPGDVTVPFNPTLINTGGKLVLIDTGNGPSAGAGVGQLFANLQAAGVTPEQIDVVLLSHLHPDHTNGLLRPDGTIAFPNATILAPEPDWTFWMSDANMVQANDPITKAYFANNRKVLTGLDERIGHFRWNTEVAPGITAVPAPGHTPGHTAFTIASGPARLLVQSDVTNIPEFFLRNPDWHVMYDHDPEQAATTRHAIYNMAAAEHLLVVGYHFAFPSLGHVERVATGYRLMPIAWQAAL